MATTSGAGASIRHIFLQKRRDMCRPPYLLYSGFLLVVPLRSSVRLQKRGPLSVHSLCTWYWYQLWIRQTQLAMHLSPDARSDPTRTKGTILRQHWCNQSRLAAVGWSTDATNRPRLAATYRPPSLSPPSLHTLALEGAGPWARVEQCRRLLGIFPLVGCNMLLTHDPISDAE